DLKARTRITKPQQARIRITKPQQTHTLASDLDTPSLSMLVSPAVAPKPKYDRGRNSSISTGEVVSKPYIDTVLFKVHKYKIGDCNVGQLFHKFQENSATTVNNFDITATSSNISKFLVMNYIFTTFEELPDLPLDVLQTIRQTYVWPSVQLDDDALHLCADLDQQLAMGEQIQVVVGSSELRKILPVQYDFFSKGLEDTYCHQVIDALVTSFFPARSTKYHVDWANGKRRGHGHGYRPDGCIKKHGRQIAFLEVKPPGDSHTAKEYLWDYWNLANFTNATRRPHHKGSRSPTFPRTCTAYIPFDQSDSNMAGCIRLFRSLEAYLEQTSTNVQPRTPPRIEYDDIEPQEDQGRPSKVSP
ncbi:hypothetical protein BX616_006456, partial [Lobosporangium transversale]